MKLSIEDIIDKHKGTPAVIGCHGPSLNEQREKIEDLQSKGKVIRLSTNKWYEFFNMVPDYWILSNTETTVKNQLQIMNKAACPVFYADTVDLTDSKLVEEHLKVDYLPYDQRHFKNHKCVQILKNFKSFYELNNSFEFKHYGNNETMWKPPRCFESFAGFEPDGPCCKKMNSARRTIQEEVQILSGHSQHCSTGDTTAMEMIMFAILFGCSPIYITGMDLDYSLGYATKDGGVRPRLEEHAFAKLRPNLYNDLKILDESAKLRDIKIINLNKDTWFDIFAKGDLEL